MSERFGGDGVIRRVVHDVIGVSIEPLQAATGQPGDDFSIAAHDIAVGPGRGHEGSGQDGNHGQRGQQRRAHGGV